MGQRRKSETGSILSNKRIDYRKLDDNLPDDDPEVIIAQKSKERQQVIRSFKYTILRKNGLNVIKSATHILILTMLIKLASKGISARERVRLKQASLYFQFKKIVLKS